MAHHLAERAHSLNVSFIDIGHFSEQEGMRRLAEVLGKRFPDVRFEYVEQTPLWSTE
jgi:putative NIF3 family GTP cyclohydrolase 1 type 2